MATTVKVTLTKGGAAPKGGWAWLWIDVDHDENSSGKEMRKLEVATGYSGSEDVNDPVSGTLCALACQFSGGDVITVNVDGIAPFDLRMDSKGRNICPFTLP